MLEIIESWCVWMSDEERLEEHTHVAISISEYKSLKERVQELEEDNKNLQVLSSINRKEHMRIHEQNKRYREFLEDMYNHAYGLQLYPHAVDEIKKLLEETENA